jgi:glycosyltransferase involved in cell wall biosynthesis
MMKFRRHAWMDPGFSALPDALSLFARRPESRDILFQTIVRAAQLILVFSDTTRCGFVEFLPAGADKVRVAPLASMLWSASLEENPEITPSKYHIPPRFVLLVNQFSPRNNQAILLPALSILKQSGLRIPFVVAGSPSDIENLSEFFQMCSRLELMKQVHLLGNLAYTELVSIMITRR